MTEQKKIEDVHLVLATIDEEARPLSIRVLGAYSESIGVRTTLLVILRRLASFGHPVEFSKSEVRQIADFLSRHKVTHLGFYLMTASLKPYSLLVKALRESGFHGVIMAGGAHPTLCPGESLVEGADFAVQGPGEVPLEMILKGSPQSEIPGLVWRDGTIVKVNPQTPAQKLELDGLPFQLFRFDRDMALVNGKLRRLDWKIYRDHAGWHGRYYDTVTSRGCLYRCSYCCNAYGAPLKRSSVDRLIRELKHVKEVAPKISGINIHDDTFFAGSDEWIAEFCSRIKSEVGLPFIVRMIPRFVKKERLELLKAAGLEYVTMGLEGSSRMNRKVFNRQEDCESFLKAAKMVLESNLLLSIDYIINNPYERDEDLREVARTLNFLPRGHWWIVALSLTPFPNTRFYEKCVSEKRLDEFATDAYDAMLIPSKPGGYRTPRFWLELITTVLPHLGPEAGSRLIDRGQNDEGAVKIVSGLTRSIRTTRKVTNWFRDATPTLYSAAYWMMKGVSRRKRLPSGMKAVE
jgi:radical SAM superfamily enzyme YgiQ (UPF0313 family)